MSTCGCAKGIWRGLAPFQLTFLPFLASNDTSCCLLYIYNKNTWRRNHIALPVALILFLSLPSERELFLTRTLFFPWARFSCETPYSTAHLWGQTQRLGWLRIMQWGWGRREDHPHLQAILACCKCVVWSHSYPSWSSAQQSWTCTWDWVNLLWATNSTCLVKNYFQIITQMVIISRCRCYI